MPRHSRTTQSRPSIISVSALTDSCNFGSRGPGTQPGLRTDGPNIFVHHHPARPNAPILCDFGVEVTRRFETAGEVYATETPAREAAGGVHRGPYNRMNEAHIAIGKWMMANRRESAGYSWEIYRDPAPDPAGTETTIVYLLK
jgi:hypothetical protein